jgi:hypothetical protein
MVGTSVGRYDNRQLCCAVKDTQLPEKYKQNSDVPNQGPSLGRYRHCREGKRLSKAEMEWTRIKKRRRRACQRY